MGRPGLEQLMLREPSCEDRSRTSSQRPCRNPCIRSAPRPDVIVWTLTALAIWILSYRIACINWRLYRITGHWPVAKVCDFAQPKPMRIPSTPVFAFSSTPPGSSVT